MAGVGSQVWTRTDSRFFWANEDFLQKVLHGDEKRAIFRFLLSDATNSSKSEAKFNGPETEFVFRRCGLIPKGRQAVREADSAGSEEDVQQVLTNFKTSC